MHGRLIKWFAVVADLAECGNSLFMTFMVNHDGVVYWKDLGEKTAAAARTMEAFDPDSRWVKVE